LEDWVLEDWVLGGFGDINPKGMKDSSPGCNPGIEIAAINYKSHRDDSMVANNGAW